MPSSVSRLCQTAAQAQFGAQALPGRDAETIPIEHRIGSLCQVSAQAPRVGLRDHPVKASLFGAGIVRSTINFMGSYRRGFKHAIKEIHKE